jgi:hypothetical protein
MQMDTEGLVRDYLGRLEAAAWTLAGDRRSELVGEVREHIEVALTDAGRRDEVTVRNVLDRLGPPEEIVSAEVGSDAAPSGAAAVLSHREGRLGLGAVEIVALLLLTVGTFVLPLIGPLLGLAFVWASTLWTTRDKIIGSAIAVLLLLLPVLLLFSVRAISS